jgi:molecular chaperone DnaK (HSP70)
MEYLKQAAETYHGHEIKGAVITVPARFNLAQRQSIKVGRNGAKSTT